MDVAETMIKAHFRKLLLIPGQARNDGYPPFYKRLQRG